MVMRVSCVARKLFCATQQRQKAVPGGNHDYIRHVNSSAWTNEIWRMFSSGIGRDMLRRLDLEADFSGGTDGANVA